MSGAKPRLDLPMLIAVALGALLVTLSAAPPWSRAILDLPLILLFPGYAFLELFFPARAPRGIERLAFSLIGSLAIVIVVGIVVQTVFALDREAWIISMATVVIAIAAAAMVARALDPGRAPSTRGLHPSRTLARLGGALTAGLTAGLAAVMIAVAAGIAAIAIAIASNSAADARSDANFTALSILPTDSTSDGRAPVRVAIENETGRAADYKLEVRQGADRLAVRHPAVADGSTWAERFPVASSIESRQVTATLWLEGRLYRRVYLRSDPSR
jgi:uncharacterized membrane protein